MAQQNVESLDDIKARYSKRALTRDELPLVRWIIDKHIYGQRIKASVVRIAFWITTTGGVLVLLKEVAAWYKP